MIAQLNRQNRPDFSLGCTGLALCEQPELFQAFHRETKEEIVVFKGAVFVQGDFANQQTKRIFYNHGYEITNDIDLADIVVWTGGADINPGLYGEKPSGAVGWSNSRDEADIKAIHKAKDQFKVGICRGAQLLNCIPNGGSLWQDVDEHVGDHSILDLITKKPYVVNSLHHQQMRPTDKAEIIAVTKLARVKARQNHSWHVDNNEDDPDIEALWYPETKSLCVQWHPEFGGADSTSYFFNLMDRYYNAA